MSHSPARYDGHAEWYESWNLPHAERNAAEVRGRRAAMSPSGTTNSRPAANASWVAVTMIPAALPGPQSAGDGVQQRLRAVDVRDGDPAGQRQQPAQAAGQHHGCHPSGRAAHLAARAPAAAARAAGTHSGWAPGFALRKSSPASACNFVI